MRPFLYQRAASVADAVAGAAPSGNPVPPTLAATQFLAGGTTLLDLMKLDVMQPDALIDIGDLGRGGTRIERRSDALYLSAVTRMAEAAQHPDLMRDYPVVVQSLDLAASPQIRNMATLGGNVLQRTRCTYFRDTAWAACNKRDPGSGCAALDGVNRKHAVLGVSDQCIAAYPGDFAQALIVLDALVEIAGPQGVRVIPLAGLHRAPGDAPQVETVLMPGDLITGFALPVAPWTRRSVYLKVRDRESYEFALASAAVALDMGDDGAVKAARIALGGVATKPWRAHEAEAALAGKHIDQGTARAAAEAAFAAAKPRDGNAYKPELGKRTLVRALLQASEMSI
ncbi:MAG TPA: xanthine dehydrogenase family protein subunit M [Stellaceae bacterium]|jgi:xanthine dehydrogenase YagS FAD-binding subunit|nr:xanthine dehydrogenase family protein subunit M [Stellaceae bacterium]